MIIHIDLNVHKCEVIFPKQEIFTACLCDQTEASRGKPPILNSGHLANFDNSWHRC